jgi:hypothetical protein
MASAANANAQANAAGNIPDPPRGGNFTAQRILIFNGNTGGVPFTEFLTNFAAATSAIRMTDAEKKSMLFSHFDGPALQYLNRNPGLMDLTFEQSIKLLDEHFSGIKVINPAIVGTIFQQPNESVVDFVRKMKDAVVTLIKEPGSTENMDAGQLAIHNIKRETRQALAAQYIRPYFIANLRNDLKPHLGQIYDLGLDDMVKELSKWEAFQQAHHTSGRMPFIGMVEGNNADIQQQQPAQQPIVQQQNTLEQHSNQNQSVTNQQWGEDAKNELFNEFEQRRRNQLNTGNDWQHQSNQDSIPNRIAKQLKRFARQQNRAQQPQQPPTQSGFVNNIAASVPEVNQNPLYNMQHAANILASINPPVQNTGLIQQPPNVAQSLMPTPMQYAIPPPLLPTPAQFINPPYQSNPQGNWGYPPNQQNWDVDQRLIMQPYQQNRQYQGYQRNRNQSENRSDFNQQGNYPHNRTGYSSQNFQPTRNYQQTQQYQPNYRSGYNNQGGRNRSDFNRQPGYPIQNGNQQLENVPRGQRFCTYCQMEKHTIGYCDLRKAHERALMEKQAQPNQYGEDALMGNLPRDQHLARPPFKQYVPPQQRPPSQQRAPFQQQNQYQQPATFQQQAPAQQQAQFQQQAPKMLTAGQTQYASTTAPANQSKNGQGRPTQSR